MDAIPTPYRGMNFGSRLEAQWALFFDTLGEPYEYQPETSQSGDDPSYIPDFLLSRRDVWLETTSGYDELPIRKAAELYRATKKNVLIFTGFPEVKVVIENFSDSQNHVLEICSFGIFALDEKKLYTVGTLNERMLFILGLLTRDTTKEEFRAHTQRLVEAASHARAYFHYRG